MNGWLQTPAAGLVLISGIQSCVKVVSNSLSIVPGIDMFKNYKKISSVLSPMFVMHGEEDEVVPFWHGQGNSELSPNLHRFVPVPGIGHNDIYRRWDFWGEELTKFVQAIKSGESKPLESLPHTTSFFPSSLK